MWKSVFVAVALVFSACDLASAPEKDAPLLDVPPGFEPVPVPELSPLTAERVALGERLFFDPSLSRNGTVACSSCHRRENAFADPRPVSLGVDGGRTFRNAPSLVNVAYNRLFFHDGGALTLESQALAPLENVNEMGMNLGDLVDRLKGDPGYSEAFRAAFGREPDIASLTASLAAFERTIRSGGSRFDRFRTGETGALTASERRGFELFNSRAGCAACHEGVRLESQSFLNNGLAFVAPDSGRARITLDSEDFGKFRVPSLRNVMLTAPYMHDGRLATLDEVLEHYDRGGAGVRGKDDRIRPLNLTPSEKEDLTAFLGSLTDTVIKTGLNKP